MAADEDWERLGTKKEVARPAMATPKLMESCCMVLAMVLAALGLLVGGVGVDQGVHAGVLEGGEASVEEGPCRRMTQMGVWTPMVAKSISKRPRTRVFEMRIQR